MATKKMKQGLVTGAALVVAGAAAAAGYYFYGSEQAPKHRKAVAKWASDMKKDVIKRGEQLKKIDAASIASVVDQVSRAYTGIKSIHTSDVIRAAKELKNNWQSIAKELGMESPKPMGKRANRTKKVGGRTMKKATEVA